MGSFSKVTKISQVDILKKLSENMNSAWLLQVLYIFYQEVTVGLTAKNIIANKQFRQF
jgi:hypothetical protein